MGKFFNKDYDEVEAFTQEELDAKIKEATTKLEADHKTALEEVSTKLTAKTTEYDSLSKKYDKRKEEYDNANARIKELEEVATSAGDDKKQAFEKMRDSYIDRAAGEDAEYKEELKKQFDRVGEESLDPAKIESSLKEAHALALNSLNRDFTAFDMASASTGEPPAVKPEGDKAFTDTDEGKATMSHVYQSMGMEVKSDDDKK